MSRLTQFAQAVYARRRAASTRLNARSAALSGFSRTVLSCISRNGIYFGTLMYQFIVVAGRFVCTIGVVTLYAATTSFMVTILGVFHICVNTLYHSTILCGYCLEGTFNLSRQGFRTTIALLRTYTGGIHQQQELRPTLPVPTSPG